MTKDIKYYMSIRNHVYSFNDFDFVGLSLLASPASKYQYTSASWRAEVLNIPLQAGGNIFNKMM